MTIVKSFLTTIVVGSIGLHLLLDLGIGDFSPRDISLGAQVVGALLFGTGWAIIGYCPGTSVGALTEGRFHAALPILGMLIGSFIFTALYPLFESVLRALPEKLSPDLNHAGGDPCGGSPMRGLPLVPSRHWPRSTGAGSLR